LSIALLGAVAIIGLTMSTSAHSAAELKMQSLVSELKQERLTGSRHEAQAQLESAGEAAVPALVSALYSDDVVLRRNASDMLGYIASPQARLDLEKTVLNDRAADVRINAAWALGEIQNFASWNALQHVAIMDTNERVRNTAADSLARIKTRLALASGVNERDLNAIAVAPLDSNIAYLTTGRDLFSTVNGGKTWSVAPQALPSTTTQLAISPTNSKILYAGVDSLGIFKSEDAGRTWTEQNTGLPIKNGARVGASALTIDPKTDYHVIAAITVWLGTGQVTAYPVGIYETTDGGESWHLMDVPVTETPLKQLALDNLKLYGSFGDRTVSYPLD